MLKHFWIESTLNSFGQIFFSKNKIFSILLILVCFLLPISGFFSLIFVLFINLFAYFIGLEKEWIKDGVFGFNAVLLATSLTQLYEINLVFLIVCLSAIILLLINTVWISAVLGKYNVPMVSFPFLFTYWIISLGIRSLPTLEINESALFQINFHEVNQANIFYQITHSLDFISLPKSIEVYFKTLGSVFFQPTIFAGSLVAIGLIYFSRIAFTFSVISLMLAYLFYSLIGANVLDLNENLAGANYVFMGIGLGCFYVIPNKWSYLMVIVLTPVLLLMYLFFGKIMYFFQLQGFTLAFSVCTVITLFMLNHRVLHKLIHLVGLQYYSAEKTIYKYVSSLHRFKNNHYFKFQLPFWGEWKVSQGYNGSITHLNEWKNALDFVIVNQEDETYKNPGSKTDDFYCFNKPILAPADGYVYMIENSIEDNKIGDVDVENNWGNSIVINHLNGLYTQISHIKKDSFKVFIGDFVTKGTIIATCGNSGRSPHPYPIAYFIERKNNELKLKYYKVPKENSIIQGIKPSESLLKVFQLWPSQKMSLISDNHEQINWEVFTNAWNLTYLYCTETKSLAYFVNDGSMFYFFDFEGDKTSLLFQFYLACNRVLLGIYPNLTVNDQIPLHYFNNKVIKFFQDFLAPFYLFTDIKYSSFYTNIDDPNNPSSFIFNSNIERIFLKKSKIVSTYQLEFIDNKIVSFTINDTKAKKIYQCELN
jgi:urea transporter